jgi:DNA/RNA-binding domain of Phe-tRNA-synthetase-like protein
MTVEGAVFAASAAWRARWPGASGGVLAVSGFTGDGRASTFDESLTATETWLRERHAEMPREEIRQTGNLAHYHRYYRSFGQNYHVQHQIESIAKKGRTIPRRQILVEIGFKWELRNGLLTGVHDAGDLTEPLMLDAASDGVTYTLYNGDLAAIKPGDMYYHDGRDVLSSIVLGPSAYARVTDATSDALVTVYGAPGVSEDDVHRHLEAVWSDILLVSPTAEQIALQTTSA